MEQDQAAGLKAGEPTIGEAKAKAKLMSISIAMFMAVVAMLGAVTAYRAALAEQDTLRFERRLQQGQMLELVHRQELLSKLASRTRYENSAALHSPTDDDQEQSANPTPDRRQAALKKLHAEEEAAHVRSLQPYLEYFRVDLPYGLEPSVAMNTAWSLRALGFDTAWEPPKPDGTFPSIWQKLEMDVTVGRHKVLKLAEAVVLFVVGLAFLTFAQLSHNAPGREKLLARIGGMLALIGLMVAMWADPSSWKDFLIFTAAFGVLAYFGTPLARRFHFKASAEGEERCSEKDRGAGVHVGGDERGENVEDEPVHPAEVEPALFAGMRLHTAPVAHGFGRFVISMIAVCAVLSALSGFFYSGAAVKSSRAVSAALDNQADRFRMNSREVTVWNYMVGRLATAEDDHLRYEAARQRLELAKEEPDLLSQSDAAEQVQVRRKILEKFNQTDPQIQEMMTGDLGPERDVHFPSGLVISKSYHEPAKALALWSANNEKSLGYQRQATTFLALLTLFAIALYLLGQALGMGRTSAAFILVVFACALAFAGVVRGVFVTFLDKPIELRPASAECLLSDTIPDDDLMELAAEHFARGWVLYEGSGDDREGSAKAAKEFGCALQIRPSFAAANLFFAYATNHASTPQLNEGGFVSLISKDALDKVAHAEQQASDLLTQQDFAPPMDLMANVGFDSYADGLIQGNRGLVEHGRKATEAAIKLSPNEVVPRFNLGLAQMAEGDEKQSLETYRKTMAMDEPGKDPYVTNDSAVIGGAITDLDVFRQYCGGLNQATYCEQFVNTDLPKLKSELVTAAWPVTEAPANSGLKLEDIHLSGSAAGLGWSARVDGLSKDTAGKLRDSLAILWYAYSPDWNAWRVLPAISERVKPAFLAEGNPRKFYSALRASEARICMQNGRYRAEFYVAGELAGMKEITLDHEELKPEMFPDLDVAVCRPKSWQRWEPQDKDAVWTRGFLDPGEHRGVFVFSFFDPQQEGRDASEQLALRRAENILHNEGLAPASAGVRALEVCAGLQGNPEEVMAAFSDGDGNSIAKAWTTKEGLVNVVAVVDPHVDVNELGTQILPQSQGRQDCEILQSATTVHE
jgi:hypothetical protein